MVQLQYEHMWKLNFWLAGHGIAHNPCPANMVEAEAMRCGKLPGISFVSSSHLIPCFAHLWSLPHLNYPQAFAR